MPTDEPVDPSSTPDLASPRLPEEILHLIFDELVDKWRTSEHTSHLHMDTAHSFISSSPNLNPTPSFSTSTHPTTDNSGPWDDVVSCTLVSRGLAFRSRHHIFRNVTLKGDNVAFSKRIGSLDELMDGNDRLGTYVRSLDLQLTYSTVEDEADFTEEWDKEAFWRVLGRITGLESLSLVVEERPPFILQFRELLPESGFGSFIVCTRTGLGLQTARRLVDMLRRNAETVTELTYVNLVDLPLGLITSSPHLTRITLKDIAEISPLEEDELANASPPVKLQSARLLVYDKEMEVLSEILPRRPSSSAGVSTSALTTIEIRVLDAADLDAADLDAAWTFLLLASQSLESLIMTDLTSLFEDSYTELSYSIDLGDLDTLKRLSLGFDANATYANPPLHYIVNLIRPKQAPHNLQILRINFWNLMDTCVHRTASPSDPPLSGHYLHDDFGWPALDELLTTSGLFPELKKVILDFSIMVTPRRLEFWMDLEAGERMYRREVKNGIRRVMKKLDACKNISVGVVTEFIWI